MAVVEGNMENFEELVLKEQGTVLVDFWASWCGPCKMLSPVIEQIAETRTDVKVCKVNVDENPALAMEYKVMSIPMLLVFRNGTVVNQSIGVISKEEVEALLA